MNFAQMSCNVSLKFANMTEQNLSPSSICQTIQVSDYWIVWQPSCRIIELSDYRTVGLQRFRSIGLSSNRAVELSNCRTFELSDYRGLSGNRAVGLSNCMNIRLSGRRAVGLQSCKTSGQFLSKLQATCICEILPLLLQSLGIILRCTTLHHSW